MDQLLTDIISRMEGEKKEANKLFGQGKYEIARKTYEHTLSVGSKLQEKVAEMKNKPSEEADQLRNEQPVFYKKHKDEFEPLIVILYANLAMCCLKSGDYQDCCDFATKALEINDHHEKSWYRLAMGHDKLARYELSLEAFDSLLNFLKGRM